MAETPLDFSRCPACGEELEVKSLESLTGANYLTLTVGDDGSLVGAAFGLTEPHWENCVTTAYICALCDEELPEAYQAALDTILPNFRQPEE